MQDTPDDILISRAVDWLVARWETQPGLDEIARAAGCGATRFHKLFLEKTGVSPKRFVQALTHRHARELLEGGGVSTLEAAYASGLSGQGRLHDLFIRIEAASPGEVRAGGAGLEVRHGFAPSPFGEIIAAATSRGLCYLGFRVDDSRESALARMRAHLPRARHIEDAAAVAPYCAAVNALCGPGAPGGGPVRLHLFGTNFQMQVWRALLKIPSGRFVSYQGVAHSIGAPRAARAVGGAVGANPVSLLIPCHRVIRQSGGVDQYGWGSARKKALLAVECCDTNRA